MHRLYTTLVAAAAALAAAALPGGSFKPSGSTLLDANGNEFMMRGCNYSWCWQRGHEYSVIPAAKRVGCNVIRIQLGDGKTYHKPSSSELESLIKLCEDNKLVAMFNIHDETGSNNIDDLRRAANTWLEWKDVLNRHLSTVLVNIANEWYGSWSGTENWANGYKEVIPTLRDGGIKNTLVVDCAGYGQYPNSIFAYGKSVAETDRLANTILSMHFYQDAAGSDSKVRSNIDNALKIGVPVIIGEMSYRHQGHDVAWQTLLDYAAEKRMGFLVWSWTGNGGGAQDCDMFGSYDDSNWKPNGTNCIKGRNGVAQTSKECSVFGGVVDPDPEPGPDPDPDPSGELTVVASHNFSPAADAGNWANDIHVPAGVFSAVSKYSTVRLHLNKYGNANIQLAVKLHGNWTQFNDYDAVGGSTFDIKLADTGSMSKHVSTDNAIAGLREDGLYVKGEQFALVKCELLNPKAPAGISDAAASTDIDWDKPVEIYTLQGLRVTEMTPGNMYIIRQGNVVKKMVK